MTILIISAACCIPTLAVFDEQAKRIIDQAAREAGVNAEAKIVPGSAALYSNALSGSTKSLLLRRFNRNEQGPAILIDGKIVAFGVPKLEDMKAIFENKNG